MSNLMTDSNSRSNLLRIGALVAIACLVATAVWLGARGRAFVVKRHDKAAVLGLFEAALRQLTPRQQA